MQPDASSPTQTEVVPEDRSTEFVPVSGGEETTSAEALLIAAYLLMWAFVFGFVALTIKRQKKLDQRLGDVESELARLDQVAGGASGQAGVRTGGAEE